jgi:hypothetical protein
MIMPIPSVGAFPPFEDHQRGVAQRGKRRFQKRLHEIRISVIPDK